MTTEERLEYLKSLNNENESLLNAYNSNIQRVIEALREFPDMGEYIQKIEYTDVAIKRNAEELFQMIKQVTYNLEAMYIPVIYGPPDAFSSDKSIEERIDRL